MSDSIKVTLAYDVKDAAGKNHKAGATADLPEQEAMNLVHSGRARLGENPKPAPTAADSGTTTKEK